MKISTLSIALASSSLVLLAAGGCGSKSAGGSGGGGTVAVVNGTPITKDEFGRYLMLKPRVAVALAEPTRAGLTIANVAQPLGLQALEDMVQRKIVSQLAKDEGVWPSETDISAEIQFQEKTNPQFVKQQVEKGLTTGMIKDEIALDLAQEKLVTKGVTVTPQEVEAYIKENPKQFQVPAQADLLLVYVRANADRKAVDDELKRGQPFEAVAMRYSQLPGARENKGRYGMRVVDRMPEEIKKIVLNAKPLQPTDWVAAQAGSAKFYVLNKIPAKPIPIDDTVKERVRRELAKRRGASANDLQARLMDRLRKSDIQVQEPLLEEPWKRAFDRLKSQGAANSMDAAAKPEATK